MRLSILGASKMLNVLIQHLPLQSLFWTKLWRAFRASDPSSSDLVKDIPPISHVIMGAPGSLFFTGKEFIMMELTVSLSWIRLGLLWGVHIPFKNFA